MCGCEEFEGLHFPVVSVVDVGGVFTDNLEDEGVDEDDETSHAGEEN